MGKIGTGTISHDLNRWWASLRGKEDPFLKVTEMNDRAAKAGSRYVWALKDINLEVKQGEILGIIGKNGAGKSTLLKILSRVTTPTTGQIIAWGRIASLLEVGTGFHPEMTGRENIFMNGSIMGMSKNEIKRKFDEIVDFAGVEKYIDTPVKRYSSGMTVRLGFAIAAHLEPKILVVDEVLAVGDAEFQKKAVGKMQEVSHDKGRTVLFVSHNMAAVKQLCSKVVVLDSGSLAYYAPTENSINYYQEISFEKSKKYVTGNRKIKVKEFSIENFKKELVKTFCTFDEVIFKVVYEAFENVNNVTFAVCFNNELNQRITSLWSLYSNRKYDIKKGKLELVIHVPMIHLIPGTYEIVLYVESNGIVMERIDNYSKIIVGYSNKYEFVKIPSLGQGQFLEYFNVTINNSEKDIKENSN